MQLFSGRQIMRLFLVTIFFVVLGSAWVHAQDASGVVTVTGKLDSINSDGTIVIDGVTYKLGSGVASGLQVGNTITITADVSNDGTTLIVLTVSIVNPTSTPTSTTSGPTATPATPTATATATATKTPNGTPTATHTPLPTSNVVVVIEGPVQKIEISVITIYEVKISLHVDDPILKGLKIGDFVRVHGNFRSDGILIATTIINVFATSNNASVTLNGPVQSISGNVVVVNGIKVQLNPDDPQLATLKIGDRLDIEGNFQHSGDTIILIVINVIIVNNGILIIGPGCSWNIDAMGMVVPGMGPGCCDPGPGMGDPGMGDPGMGMGGPGIGCCDPGMGDPGMGMGDPAMGRCDPGPAMGDPGMGMGDPGMGMGK